MQWNLPYSPVYKKSNNKGVGGEEDITCMKQFKIWANQFHSTEVSFLASHS